MLDLVPRLRFGAGSHPSSLAVVRAARCAFVHVPATGGASVARALYGPEDAGHRTLRDYARELGPLGGYVTVATVREPVDRFLAAYRFLRDDGGNDARFADAYVRPYASAEAFVWGGFRDPAVRTSLPFRPQWTFVCDLGRRVGVRSVIRFETLVADYDAFRTTHNVGRPLLPVGPSRRPGECLSDAARARVARLYARDYAVLGYAPPSDLAA